MSNAMIELAKNTGATVEEMTDVIKGMIISGKAQHGAVATNAEIMVVSSVCAKFGLNPLVREAHAFVSGGKLQVMIGLDGWIKLANRNPDFDGYEQTDNFDENGDLVDPAEELLKQLGISRVILPRETSLSTIEKLVKHSPFEIEIFVHGAMCYSISGRCFWSAALGTRSGNRGTCAQPCRKAYRDRHGNEAFSFSPRDLRLIDHLPQLKASGIASLKIEGRMKDADYVYRVVKAYRQVLDGTARPADLEKALDETFSRAYHTGFLNKTPTDWQTPIDPGRQTASIGRVFQTRRPDGLTEIVYERSLHPGDGLSWQNAGEREGARITCVYTSGLPPKHAFVRGLPQLPEGTQLSRSDTVGEQPWMTQWKRDWERITIDLFWSGHEDQPLAIETMLSGKPLRITSSESLKWSRGPGLEMGSLSERFALIGEQFRAGRQIFSALGKGLFISPSALKKLKRELLETLLEHETTDSRHSLKAPIHSAFEELPKFRSKIEPKSSNPPEKPPPL